MPAWPYIALFTAGLCWGLGLPLGKLALADTDAAHMILLRFLAAGVVAAPFAMRRKAARRLFRAPAVLIAGVLLAVGFLVQFEGLARSSVALCALLVGGMPTLIAVAAAVRGERVGRIAWIGIVAATAGAALIAGRPGGASLPGVLLCVASLPVFLGWMHATRHAPADADPVDVSCVTIVVAALVLIPIVCGLHGAPKLGLSWLAWAGIVGQGLLSTVVATVAWQLGAPRVASAAAGIFINIEPLVGTALGVLFFHNRLTLAAAAGGLLILAGSLAVVLGERRSKTGARAAQAPTPA